jgi:hypothetical protein
MAWRGDDVLAYRGQRIFVLRLDAQALGPRRARALTPRLGFLDCALAVKRKLAREWERY